MIASELLASLAQDVPAIRKVITQARLVAGVLAKIVCARHARDGFAVAAYVYVLAAAATEIPEVLANAARLALEEVRVGLKRARACCAPLVAASHAAEVQCMREKLCMYSGPYLSLGFVSPQHTHGMG